MLSILYNGCPLLLVVLLGDCCILCLLTTSLSKLNITMIQNWLKLGISRDSTKWLKWLKWLKWAMWRHTREIWIYWCYTAQFSQFVESWYRYNKQLNFKKMFCNSVVLFFLGGNLVFSKTFPNYLMKLRNIVFELI